MQTCIDKGRSGWELSNYRLSWPKDLGTLPECLNEWPKTVDDWRVFVWLWFGRDSVKAIEWLGCGGATFYAALKRQGWKADQRKVYGTYKELHFEGRTFSFRSRFERKTLQTMLDAYASNGYNQTQAAAAAGIDGRTARDIFKKMGINAGDYHQLVDFSRRTKYSVKLPGWKRKRSVWTHYPYGAVHRAITMYLSEERPSLRQVGEETGIPWDTIGSWVETLKISRGAGGQHSITSFKKRPDNGFATVEEEQDEIVRLYRDELLGTHEIALQLSVRQNYCHRVLKRRGIQTRSWAESMQVKRWRKRGMSSKLDRFRPHVERKVLDFSHTTLRIMELEEEGIPFQEAYELAMKEWVPEVPADHRVFATPIRLVRHSAAT